MTEYSELFAEFIEDWNEKHRAKMNIMGSSTAVAEDNEHLWVAEDRVFEVEVKHYTLKSTDIYTDD
jgi:hypothetical protein